MSGRVLQVNVSPGGVPKLPVPNAHVGRLGLAGDDHTDPAGHGGPNRAVCLLAIEAIRRVAAEGHPIAPGTTGENVTTEGVELGALPAGSRLAIGRELIVEITGPTSPCTNIAGSFLDGRFSRLSIRTNPPDTRVYASVVREGTVAPGDVVEVLAKS
jgi:MOSC domain-containing protein YiiM